jgi:hypothetical protein
MEKVNLDRRGTLIAAGVVVAGLAAYGAAGGIGAVKRCSKFAATSEVAAQSAKRIGLAYLHIHPEEASEVRLMTAVANLSILTRALNAAPDMASVFCILDDVVRADFAAGEIVKCDGWILAKSEARLCALLTLRAARSDYL